MNPSEKTAESFRDTLATIDKQGRRVWVYPLKPKGKLYRGRTILAFFLLAFYLAAPFIRVGDKPLLLLDIFSRKFFVFGVAFWPHEFYIIVLGVIALAVFVILFTAAFGRLFCGWACPQTVFMEMVFRRIEFWIEGTGSKQRRLDAAPWNAGKILRKAAKHAIFLLISFILGNVMLAYFIGSDAVIGYITQPPSEHPTGFAFVIIFTLVTYGVFARFREQVCTLVCPYGRLQSVLLDNNSIVVAYDFSRGEPREKLARGGRSNKAGDCVDCGMCVQVCPTGIDIRHGTQLECVNCTACIDVCNDVMERVGLPRKLIRYASMDKIAHKKPFRFTGRLGAYSAAFAVLFAVTTILAASTSDIDTTVLRTTGSLYETMPDGKIRNLYTVKILNKTGEKHHYSLRLAHPKGDLTIVGPELEAGARSGTESVFTVEMAPEALFAPSTLLTIEVLTNNGVVDEVRTNFSGPEPLWKKK